MSDLQFTSIVCLALITAYVFKRLDLQFFLSHRKIQHIVFGAAASVFILWMFRAGILEGLTVHFLWLPALMLTLGLRWASISGIIALLGVTALGKESWPMLGINGLLGVFLPLLLSYGLFVLVFNKLPRHLFVYIFACAFFPGALAIATKMFALTVYYWVDGVYTWQEAFDNYFILTPLMLFPEAMLNGMTMTLLIIYKPNWVYTFHDRHYLDK